MSDEQDRAEQLDGDVLGEDAADDEFPDLDQDGDIGPMNVEDPNVLQADADAQDDERTRAWREEPDLPEERDEEDEAIALMEDDDLDPEHDVTAEAVAPDDGPIAPEEAALHVEPER